MVRGIDGVDIRPPARKELGEGSQSSVITSVADGGDAGTVRGKLSRAGADACEVIESTLTECSGGGSAIGL